MKFVAISDSHNHHHSLKLPPADCILHSGDISGRGSQEEVENFLQWFSSLNQYRYKIFIAGNHDFLFEKEPELALSLVPDNIIYLQDNSITIEGIKIYGSPIQPRFFNWAFNKERGQEIKYYWDLIEEDIDILLTHGPPKGIGDRCENGYRAGCQDLLEKVQSIRPKFHIFGHIHEDYSQQEVDGTVFINASVLNRNYQLVNKPIKIEYKK